MTIEANKMTPMMSQWHACKERAKDALLLFRMGDFYEAFYEDAAVLSEAVDVTLTQRQGIPMAGIPQHTCDSYLDKLVQKGLKIAIAEQLEDPKNAKGLVKRDIVRIVTPATLTTSSLLSEKSNNFFASLSQIGTLFGLSFLDLSTGEFKVSECENLQEVASELFKLHPSEILVSKKFNERHSHFFKELSLHYHFLLSIQEDWTFDAHLAHSVLTDHFKVHNLDGFGLSGMSAGIIASGALLNYFKEGLSLKVEAVQILTPYYPSQFLQLDKTSQKNLELVSSLKSGSKKYTLLDVLDHTKTAMGGRLLKQWILQPLLNPKEIHERQEAILAVLNNSLRAQSIAGFLERIKDIERLSMKVSSGLSGPRDLFNLALSLEMLPALKNTLESFSSLLLSVQAMQLKDFSELTHKIRTNLIDEPPTKANEGGIFREGIYPELDELKLIKKNGHEWLLNYQNTLRESLGIKTLKVNFTHAFGYYIDVSKAQADKMPDSFTRKQTLVNNERFISPELKSFENKLLTAEERLLRLELELFQTLKLQVVQELDNILKAARAIAKIDVIFSLAAAAKKWNYSRPVVDTSSRIFIQEGRHPVIEATLLSDPFTANDTLLDEHENQLMLITGPNMAGKSTYIRQVALITLMAQIGSFVPAKFAHIGVVDKIFTRIGASDDLSRGQSTFMVEMIETATILNNATPSSLVILDEIGRGTSTYDGIAIAWSVAEHLLLNPKAKAKTLFATHYWELTELEDHIPGVVNMHVAVKETLDGIVFLHKIVKGATGKSYGIHVAELAGLPLAVTMRAKEILSHLEKQSDRKEKKMHGTKIKKVIPDTQLTLFQ